MEHSTRSARKSRPFPRLRAGFAAATIAALIGATMTAVPASAALEPAADGAWRFADVVDSFGLEGQITAQELDERIAAGGPFTLDEADAAAEKDLYPIWLTVTSYPE